MQNKKPILNISILADEIIVEILSRLPVKTLLQSKCVCKRWCILISTPWFVSVHLKRLSSDPDDHYIIVQSRGIGVNGLIPIRNPSCLIKLVGPCSSNASIVGSVNGLVCLSMGVSKLIYLWNPSIRQFKTLPLNNSKVDKTRKCYVSLGFGYEQNADDYKVVRIINYYQEGRTTVVEVYSTKLDSWREVQTDNYLNVTDCNCEASVDGFTYWVIRNADEPRKHVLVSFDLRREMFSIIPVPEVCVSMVESHGYRVINYHGSLALLVYSSHYEFKQCLEVWMVEGGSSGVGLWRKKFTFGMGFTYSRHWSLTNGVIVVENAPNVPFLFNLTANQRRVMGIHVVDSAFYYTESLVSIKGFKPTPIRKEN